MVAVKCAAAITMIRIKRFRICHRYILGILLLLLFINIIAAIIIVKTKVLLRYIIKYLSLYLLYQ